MRELPKALRQQTRYFENALWPVWVVKKRDLTLLWSNKPLAGRLHFIPELIFGRPLEELLVPDIIHGGATLKELLAKGPAAGFQCVIKAEKGLFSLSAGLNSVAGLKVRIQALHEGPYAVFFMTLIDSPLTREYMVSTPDFFILADENDRIQEISPNFYLSTLFQDLPLDQESVMRLLHPRDLAEIKKRRALCRAYLSTYAKNAKGPWTSVFADPFNDLKKWHPPENASRWKTGSGRGLVFDGGNDHDYLFLKESPGLSGKDFAIALAVSQEKLSRVAVVFNLKAPDKWETEGYVLGISDHLKRPVITLKKNERFLLQKYFDAAADHRYEFRIEKTGGTIRFFINRALEMEYTDLSAIPNTRGHFGILSSGRNTFSRLEIFTRDSVFDHRQTLYEPTRLSISHIPGRVYDMRYITISTWLHDELPMIREVMHFKDVTEFAELKRDRENFSQKVDFLKRKNYFGFVGGNTRVQEILDHVDNFADSGAAVLIEGPTGTGKEVLARAIHQRSSRREGPFVKVDCASVPQSLLESELFGHEKGAFTGAVSRMPGRFQAADKGTLFLDEIGNIDLNTQAKLLNFIGEHTFTPIGGNRPVKVDIRIVAATNADLGAMALRGLFREDLFYRLHVIRVALPPLKERRDDIPLLIDAFLQEINERHQLKIRGLSPQVMDACVAHDWPGNVRELHNFLINAAIQRKEGILDARPEFPRQEREEKSKRSFVPERVRHAALLKAAAERPYFSARECCGVLNVSLSTIRQDIGKLVKSGRLKPEGRGPAAKYYLVPAPAQSLL